MVDRASSPPHSGTQSAADPAARAAKIDAVIAEFTSPGYDLTFAKQQILKLLAAANERPLTMAETNRLAQLRKELKAAGAPSPDQAAPTDPTPSADSAPGTLPNIRAVSVHLKASGYKLGQSTVYNHVHAGHLRPLPSGAFSIPDVDAYAAVRLRRIDGTPVTPQAAALDQITQARADLELRKSAAQVAIMERRERILDAAYISRETHEQDLAARLTVFKGDMENFIHAASPGIIALVDGNPVKTPDLIDFLLAAGRAWLARYAEKHEFAIEIAPLDQILSAAATSPAAPFAADLPDPEEALD